MKAASKFQFRIFVVGMVIILSSLLAFSPVKAETITYHGAYKANRHAVYIGNNIDWYYDLTIVTDDENAYGTVNVTGLGSFTYSGLITYYSEIPSTSDKGMTIVGSFTGTYNSVAQETTLNSTQYNSILTALNTINSTDQNIKNAIDSMKNSIMAVLNNIDETIDTISWTDSSSDILNYYTDIDPLSNPISSTSSVNIGKHIYVRIPYNSLYRGNLIYFDSIVMAANDAKYTNFKIYMRHNNSGKVYEISYANIYNMNNRGINRIYIDNVYNFGSPYDIYVYYECELDMYFYPGLLLDPNIYYLPNSDIEYWTLKSFFEQHYSSDKLDNTNEVLDPAVDDYVNSEDNLISDFDNSISNPNVKPSTNTYSDTSGWGSSFTSSIGFVGYVYNQLLQSSQGGNPFYMLINFSLMLGLALLIIGKRG